jgi:SAM-dependent methyltransferase
MKSIIDFLKKLAGRHNEHWCRVVMNRESAKIISALSPEKLSALEISGSFWEKAGFASYKSVRFPEFDICKGTLPGKYDIILAEQVFEHLLRPYTAGRNVYSMLKDKGYFFITTPFLLKIHDDPTDCTRWTPTGLKHFLIECGFDENNISVWAWGNKKCAKASLSKWWLYYSRLHSLENEPDFPIVVWALAKK